MRELPPVLVVLGVTVGCGGSSPPVTAGATTGPGSTTSTSATSTSSTGGAAGAGGTASTSSSGGSAGAGGAGGAACVPVDDHDPCTDDLCQGGMPVHTPKADGTACPSSDACTVGSTCQAGVCAGGSPLACSGGAVCQAGACVAAACTGSLGLPGPPELS